MEEKLVEKLKEMIEEFLIKFIFVRKLKGIVVYVDFCELRSGVLKYFRELGVEVEVRIFDVVDYVVSEEVGIEWKSVNDFI